MSPLKKEHLRRWNTKKFAPTCMSTPARIFWRSALHLTLFERALRGLVLFFSLGLAACATDRVVVREQPQSVSEIRKAVTVLLGEPRSISQNGRELLSHYHDRKRIMLEASEVVKERLYTQVTILGDRRPYDIAVDVHVETKEPGGEFEETDKDEGLAERTARELKDQLYQSRSADPNVIDDFRAF